MDDLKFKIECGGLWIEERLSRFEDSVMPHLHLTHVFLSILCRETPYFEDILNL